jgi:Tol biopolymer transport system component
MRDGKIGETLGPPSTYVNVAIAPDGAHVAIDRFTPTPAIWMLDTVRGTPARETAGAAIYQSTPVWSPDGREIVFAQAVDTPPNVYRKRVGSLEEGQRVFRNAFQSFPQSWSPDGAAVAYVTIEPKTSSDIWLMSMRGNAQPTPLIRTQYIEQHPRISPDGQWLAYVSNESGRFEIYLTRFPTAEGRRQISTDGGNFPIWRRDGRELFYVVQDGTIMAATMQVTADGEVNTRQPRPLFKAPAFVIGPGLRSFYDVAPDGRFLFNVFLRRTSPPATVVLNWRADDPASTP